MENSLDSNNEGQNASSPGPAGGATGTDAAAPCNSVNAASPTGSSSSAGNASNTMNANGSSTAGSGTETSTSAAPVNAGSTTNGDEAVNAEGAAGDASPPPDPNSLGHDPRIIFIKNLDRSVDNKTLTEIFSVCGNIVTCNVAEDKQGSKGYAFVQFAEVAAARKAIEDLDNTSISGKIVRVSEFIPKDERNKTFTNLYVKNFPDTVDDARLKQLFEKFGTIVSVKVMVDEDGKSKGYGFVNFEDSSSAEKAVEEMNEKEVFGDKLFVGRAKNKAERQSELKEKYEKYNLYVKNLDDVVDDDRLREEFSKFGTITSAKVMMENGRSKGFGFICFSSQKEAERAMNEMSGRIIVKKPLYVAFSQRKEDRRAQMAAKHMQNMQPRLSITASPVGMTHGTAPAYTRPNTYASMATSAPPTSASPALSRSPTSPYPASSPFSGPSSYLPPQFQPMSPSPANTLWQGAAQVPPNSSVPIMSPTGPGLLPFSLMGQQGYLMGPGGTMDPHSIEQLSRQQQQQPLAMGGGAGTGAQFGGQPAPLPPYTLPSILLGQTPQPRQPAPTHLDQQAGQPPLMMGTGNSIHGGGIGVGGDGLVQGMSQLGLYMGEQQQHQQQQQRHHHQPPQPQQTLQPQPQSLEQMMEMIPLEEHVCQALKCFMPPQRAAELARLMVQVYEPSQLLGLLRHPGALKMLGDDVLGSMKPQGTVMQQFLQQQQQQQQQQRQQQQDILPMHQRPRVPQQPRPLFTQEFHRQQLYQPYTQHQHQHQHQQQQQFQHPPYQPSHQHQHQHQHQQQQQQQQLHHHHHHPLQGHQQAPSLPHQSPLMHFPGGSQPHPHLLPTHNLMHPR